MIYIKTTQLKYDTEWFSTEQRKLTIYLAFATFQCYEQKIYNYNNGQA